MSERVGRGIGAGWRGGLGALVLLVSFGAHAGTPVLVQRAQLQQQIVSMQAAVLPLVTPGPEDTQLRVAHSTRRLEAAAQLFQAHLAEAGRTIALAPWGDPRGAAVVIDREGMWRRLAGGVRPLQRIRARMAQDPAVPYGVRASLDQTIAQLEAGVQVAVDGLFRAPLSGAPGRGFDPDPDLSGYGILALPPEPGPPPVIRPQGVTVGPPPGRPGPTIPPPAYPPPAPAPTAMSSDLLRSIIQTVRAESFDANKLRVLQSGLGESLLLTEQARQILGVFTFEGGRLEALKQLAPRILDREQAFTLQTMFTFASNREAARRILGR